MVNVMSKLRQGAVYQKTILIMLYLRRSEKGTLPHSPQTHQNHTPKQSAYFLTILKANSLSASSSNQLVFERKETKFLNTSGIVSAMHIYLVAYSL